MKSGGKKGKHKRRSAGGRRDDIPEKGIRTARIRRKAHCEAPGEDRPLPGGKGQQAAHYRQENKQSNQHEQAPFRVSRVPRQPR